MNYVFDKKQCNFSFTNTASQLVDEKWKIQEITVHCFYGAKCGVTKHCSTVNIHFKNGRFKNKFQFKNTFSNDTTDQ